MVVEGLDGVWDHAQEGVEKEMARDNRRVGRSAVGGLAGVEGAAGLMRQDGLININKRVSFSSASLRLPDKEIRPTNL